MKNELAEKIIDELEEIHECEDSEYCRTHELIRKYREILSK